MSSVVITGVGTVSGSGIGLDPLETALKAGRPTLSPVDRSGGFHAEGASAAAVLVGKLDVHEWISPMAARRMSTPSRFAVVAARTAMESAGLDRTPYPDDSLAVVLSNSFGPPAYTKKLLDQIFGEGPATASPAVFTECVANAPASQVSIHCHAAGPNRTLCQKEAGPLTAVACGAHDVQRGKARVALAGAVEEMSPILHALLDRFGALARPAEDGAETARPFDRLRSGFLAAEGATILVLEEEERARARDCPVLARVRGWAGAYDPSASRAGWGSGSGPLGEALRTCLERSATRPEEIDLIISGASGSPAGDRLEAQVLRRIWPSCLPPVVAPKSVTGEYGGAFLAAAVLAMLGRGLGPTAGFRQEDPQLAVRPHDGAPLTPPRRALVSALASGGSAAWLVLEKA